jgi:cytochrome c oxidase subunit 2
MTAFTMRLSVLSLALAATTVASGSTPAPQGPAARVIDITAERFEFWPPEVTVAEGEVVEIRLRSEDTLHGFRLVGTGTNVMVPKRGKGVATATLAGLKPGRYTFECSRMCGAGHHFMRGSLIVAPAAGASQ